jgi:NAD(P)-dependent dehydrogenase (short-subunit alcohol dehydrogenase family)
MGITLMNEQLRIAIVTGASRGLGLVIARVLATRGQPRDRRSRS